MKARKIKKEIELFKGLIPVLESALSDGDISVSLYETELKNILTIIHNLEEKLNG